MEVSEKMDDTFTNTEHSKLNVLNLDPILQENVLEYMAESDADID